MLLLGWDGRNPQLTELERQATHLLTNVGHMYPPSPDNLEEPADPKAIRFGPKFAARRPSGDPDPRTTIKDAWADWLTLAAGEDLPGTDPGAIIVRHELPDGRVYGSTWSAWSPWPKTVAFATTSSWPRPTRRPGIPSTPARNKELRRTRSTRASPSR